MKLTEGQYHEVLLATVNLDTIKARFEGLPVDVREVTNLWNPHEYILDPSKRLLLAGRQLTPTNIAGLELLEHAGCCGMYVDPAFPQTATRSPIKLGLKRCTLPYGRHDLHRFIRLALTGPVEQEKLAEAMQRVKMQLITQQVDGFQIYPETEKFLILAGKN